MAMKNKQMNGKQLLIEWSGASAAIWDYSVSHSKIIIRLHRPNQPGNLHVLCGQCREIAGRFAWLNAVVRVEYDESRQGYRVYDTSGCFQLLCGIVAFQEDVEPVYFSSSKGKMLDDESLLPLD